LAALFLLRARAPLGERGGRGGLLGPVREALRHVQQDGVLPSALWAYGILLFFGPSMPLMLPLFAVQVMHRSAAQLGILFSAVGAGTVLGALAVASQGDIRRKGRLLFGSAWLWVSALGLLTSSASLYVSIPALLALGAAQTIAGTVVVTLLQTRVPPEMRGRAMSLNTLLIMCVRPLGDFPAGALIALLGFRPAVLISAAVVGMTSAALFVLHPAVRRA